MILLAQTLGAANDQRSLALGALELGAPGKRQVFFGRVQHLDQMALDSGLGVFPNHGVDFFDGPQKIAEEHHMGVARKAANRRYAGARCCVLGVQHQAFSHAGQGSLSRGWGAAVNALRGQAGNALAAAHQQRGDGQQQKAGALQFLARPEPGLIAHGWRAIPPQPHILGGFPFVLAHKQAVGFGRLPPVDGLGPIPVLIAAELPECFARPHPATTMDPLGHCGGHALCRHQQRRQGAGQMLCPLADRALRHDLGPDPGPGLF